MRSQVYLTLLSALRRFQFTSCVLAIALLSACGGDDDDDSVPIGLPDDAGMGGEDTPDAGDGGGDFPTPITVDAGMDIPGDPPKELADQSCAVDTNKRYDLITFDRQPEPMRLGVDLAGSRFAIAFLDKSEDCIDAVYVAQIDGEGVSAEPDISFALDPCSIIDRAGIEYDGEHWLLGTIDARMDARDLWVQEFDPKSKTKFTAHNVTKSDAAEREFALLSLGEDGVLATWVEDDGVAGESQRLMTRLLSASGEPDGDAVELDQPEDVTWSISGLAMAQFGADYVGLTYRRVDATGHAELVLDMLSRKGERDRDAWVLSTEAGAYGGIELASDDAGGGVIYSFVQGTSEQLWFQQLGLDGRVAPATSGGNIGGAVEPLRIVAPPYKANDASLTKLPNGYAVAYRALPGGNVSSARIRIHFLDRFGRIIDSSDVALASETGGRTAIKAGYDGRVVVGWSDSDDAGQTTITAIRLPCVGGL